ncbi:putative oxidoreductase [Nannochloris sp. 'desiccata']|nr:putative oxidoreductase [Chlorella desiccata (nom. nud.)]
MSVKIAVVTGTAKPLGIGRAIARALISSLNYKIVGIDIENAERLDEEDLAFKAQYTHHKCDVSSAEQVSKIWDSVEKAFDGGGGGGRGTGSSLELSCIINNAGIADPDMPVGDTNARISRWKSVVGVNLTASTRALMSEPNTEAYSASKAGLLGLTHALSQSLAGKVRVNAILPGWIDTTGGEGVKAEDHAFHPAQRVGNPEDVVEMCVFLAGPQAGFITGQEFVFDGGVTKKMIYPQ